MKSLRAFGFSLALLYILFSLSLDVQQITANPERYLNRIVIVKGRISKRIPDPSLYNLSYPCNYWLVDLETGDWIGLKSDKELETQSYLANPTVALGFLREGWIQTWTPTGMVNHKKIYYLQALKVWQPKWRDPVPYKS